MKKVLVLGGSHRDIPLIEKLKEMGYCVITLGGLNYYIGHKYADKFYKIDFSDLKLVEEVIEKEKISYIISGSGELNFYNSAYLAKKYNLGIYDSLETIEIVHNKHLFKEFCIKHGISVPKGGEDFSDLSFPIIMKPQNLSGGRGVVVVKNRDELNQKIEYTKKSSKDQKIVFEEFIEGDLIAYSVVIKDKRIVYDFIAKDEPFLNPFLISTAYTYKIEATVHKHIKADVEKIAKLLDFANGAFHLQIIIRNNKHYIIDVTRRIAGDLFPYLIECSDSSNYTQMVLYSHMGMDFTPFIGEKKYVIRHCVMPKYNGFYNELYSKLDYCYRLDLIKSGEIIENNTNTHTNILLYKFDNYDKMLKYAKNINDLVYAKIR